MSRLRARDAGLAESELIITRHELDSLRDKVYVLECAVDDAQRDLEAGDDARAILRWVVEAAEPLFATPLGETRSNLT
jgi:hypothetical protein